MTPATTIIPRPTEPDAGAPVRTSARFTAGAGATGAAPAVAAPAPVTPGTVPPSAVLPGAVPPGAVAAGPAAAGAVIAEPVTAGDRIPGSDLPGREPTRATIAILTGRGESPDPYQWLAGRLALDGYAATVVPDRGNVARAVGEVRQPGLPFVLLGSDSGALSTLAMAGSPAVRPDGLVLLGLPLLHVPVAGIPVADPPPRVLPDLPILLIHGRDDQISPLSLVRMTTRTASRTELTVVSGGHTVLAGPGRRSVPARILLFLEDLLDR